MRVHRITLTNFRGVTDATVAFADHGVTIVEGDNEAGKSTLVEALNLLLNEKSSSKKAAVLATKPVDGDVGPQAEAELTVGEQRLTIRKRWVISPETVLTLHGPTDTKVTGGDGHDRLTALLATHVDDNLLKALQVMQGTALTQASLASRQLSAALDLNVGVDTSGQHEDGLWDRILGERGRYWTETGLKKAERKQLDDRIEAATGDRDRAADALAKIEEDIATVADLNRKAADRVRRIAELRPRFDELTELVATISALEGQRAALDLEQQQAEAQRQLAEQRRTARQGLIEDVASREEIVSALTATATPSAVVEQLNSDITTAMTARNEALARRDELQQSRDAADHDERLVNDLFSLLLLEERLARYGDAQAELNNAQAALDATTITPELLAEIEAASAAQLQASGAASDQAVEVEIETEIDATITDDDQTTPIEAGTAAHLELVARTELRVPGAVRLTITPGRQVEELRDLREETTRSLAGLVERAGVADVQAARDAEQNRRTAASTVENCTRRIHDELRDLTPESLANRIAALRTSTTERQEDRADSPPLPDSPDAARVVLDAIDVALRDATTTAEQRSEDVAKLQARLRELNADADRIQGMLDQARNELTGARERLDNARTETPDNALETALGTATAVVADAKSRIEKIDSQLRAVDAPSTLAQHENQRQSIERAEGERADFAREARDLQISLDAREDQGLASELDTLETRLEELLAERERIDARADAAELLFQTFAIHRTAARERYLAPLTSEIERLGRIVFGDDVQVTLDEDLKITHRTLGGQTLPFGHLSVGAQEQLGVLARLACAALVGRDDGAPVILDDALGWSDPARLSRMGAALSAAGQTCQVIVLTCYPDRYATVGGATAVQLRT
jgi:DNA repair exonuclease SbcCD ATPase subunit